MHIIRRATKADFPDILRLFDLAQAWLCRNGLEVQWGTRPFSDDPRQSQRFEAWIAAGELQLLFLKFNQLVGALVVTEKAPSYAESAFAELPGQALYLEAFATDPARRGQGLGRHLLDWAESQAEVRSIEYLRLDCWSGNERLRRYYREVGYRESAHFAFGSWQGVVMEKVAKWTETGSSVPKGVSRPSEA